MVAQQAPLAALVALADSRSPTVEWVRALVNLVGRRQVVGLAAWAYRYLVLVRPRLVSHYCRRFFV